MTCRNEYPLQGAHFYILKFKSYKNKDNYFDFDKLDFFPFIEYYI